MKKVLAICSSPRTEYISTNKTMLSAFISGLRENGAEVIVYYTSESDIKMCTACMSCCSYTDGQCVIADEMTRKIYPEFLEADILVLATPIYFGNLSAGMKNFIDRLFPFLSRFQHVEPDGSFQHTFRKKWPEVYVFSSSSWQAKHAFAQLSSYMHYLFGTQLKAEFYRGDEGAFSHYIKYSDQKRKILKTIYECGKFAAFGMEIPPDNIAIITADLGSPENMVAFHNLSIDSSTNFHMNTNRWTEYGNQMLPGNLERFELFYQMAYHKEECNVPFTVQFDFTSGLLNGQYHMKVGEDILTVTEGAESAPDLTIRCDYSVWMDIANHNRNSLRAVTDGDVQIIGDSNRLKDISRIFYLTKDIL